MLKRLLSLVLAALIAVPAPALPAQVAPPSIERQVAHGAGDAAPALPRLAQRLGDTIPPLYMLGGDDKIVPVASFNAATDPTFPSSSLTFSRTSLATMFDSTGKLTYAPNNLLTYSNTFSNAAWLKTAGATISNANSVADPFGGTQASTFTASSTGVYVYQQSGGSVGTKIISAIWIKRRTGSGVVKIQDAAGTDIVVPVSASWQQFSASAPLFATSGGYGIAVYIATSGDAVDIYAATTSAVTYETTPRADDQVITTSAAYYGPRIDYDPNTLAVKGLLIEEARTNLVVNSGAVATGAATTAATITAGQSGAPDGSASYALVQASNTLSGNHYIYRSAPVSISAATIYTFSTFVKASGQRYVTLLFSPQASLWYAATLDLQTGIITQTMSSGGSAANLASAVQSLGGGVYRLSVTGNSVAATLAYLQFQLETTGTPTLVSWGYSNSTPANTTDGALVWGWDLEAGPFATSYIPTAASSVTRAADVVQFTGAALTALQGSAASLVAEWTSGVSPSTSNAYILSAVGGAGLRIWTTNSYRLTNGTNTIDATLPSGNVQQLQRTGFAYSGAGRSVVASGGTVTSDANGAAMSGTIYFGSSGGSAAFINEHIKSFAIYNQRLSDATLQAKSVVGASYAANDNVNPFAPQFAANDNLPVHWRIAL